MLSLFCRKQKKLELSNGITSDILYMREIALCFLLCIDSNGLCYAFVGTLGSS